MWKECDVLYPSFNSGIKKEKVKIDSMVKLETKETNEYNS